MPWYVAMTKPQQEMLAVQHLFNNACYTCSLSGMPVGCTVGGALRDMGVRLACVVASAFSLFRSGDGVCVLNRVFDEAIFVVGVYVISLRDAN